MKKLHFKRQGFASMSYMSYENCYIELHQGKKPSVIMIKYADESCNTIEKKETKNIPINSSDNIIEVFKEIIENFLKSNTSNNIELETWIEAYYPGSNTDIYLDISPFLKNDISIMNVVLKDKTTKSIRTDEITVKEAIKDGVDIYNTWKQYYSPKIADKLKDLLLNPPKKILELSMTELYLLIHNHAEEL